MPRYLCYLLLVVSVLSASCSSAPRRELQSARLAVAQARHAGADQWASAE
ncbi:MAG: hypothetical protein IH614_09740, partial [Desulfuromonadales bacterium]|nr:hypothetical protein [Desulfuromonadales bacterium]